MHGEWSASLRLVGSAETAHPSKLVLQAASVDGSGGLDVYRTYLRRTLNLNVSHSVIGALSDGMLARFYSLDDPLQPPKFFDWAAGGGRDLSRLEMALGVDLLVFETSQPACRDPGWNVLHDRSVYRLLSGDYAAARRKVVLFVTMASRARTRGGKPGSPLVVFYAGDELSLSRMRVDALGDLELRGYVAKKDSLGNPPAAGGPCYLERWARLLGRELAEKHVHSPFCVELVLALSDWRAAVAAMRPEAEFCVVAHLRTSVHRSSGAVRYFGMLMASPSPGADCAVLCVLADGSWIAVRDDKARRMLTADSRARYPPLEDPPRPFDGLRPGRRADPPPPQPVPFPEGNFCDCKGCAGARLYERSMKPSGPSILYNHATTLFDLMRSVGVFTTEAESAVNRCCELSLSALDVETFTVDANPEPGNEDAFLPCDPISDRSLPRLVTARMEPVLIGYADALSESDGARVFGGWTAEDEARTKRRLVSDFCRHLEARKEEATVAKMELLAPLLDWVGRYREAYTGYFRESGYLSPDRDEDEILEAASDELVRCLADMDCDELEEEWTERADESEAVSHLLRLRSDRLTDSVCQAYEASIFGRLEAALLRLAELFVCFSHNGMGFDHIVIGADIVCHFRSAGRSVRMSRQGLKVRSIAVSGQLHFAESTLLLSPGTSLDALGRLAGLEIRKFRFPFEMLRDFDFLRRTELPREASLWASSLTSKNAAVSQEDVDYYLDLYAREKHACVGSFLKRYLELDVLILQRSMLRIMAGYYELLGVNPLQSFKLTISSLACFAVQTELFRKKRIGFFFCNNRRTYSILKEGMRGGYVAVHRTAAGREADLSEHVELFERQIEGMGPEELETVAPNLSSYACHEDYLRACNPGLPSTDGKPNGPADYVHYLDVNSLYGSSARASLPFGPPVLYSMGPSAGAPPTARWVRDGGSAVDAAGGGKRARPRDYGSRCRRPEAVLRREPQPGGRPCDPLDSEESLFAQYMTLEVFPKAVFAFSGFHASSGQQTFGPAPQHKADLALVLREPNPSYSTEERELVGAADYEAKPERTRLAYFNYHGRYRHFAGKHDPCCPRVSEDCAADCHSGEALEADRVKVGLAEALSAVDPNLRVTYETVTSCQLFCRGSDFPRAGFWNPDAADGDVREDARFGSVRELLRLRHPGDSLLGLRIRQVSQAQLVNLIMREGSNFDGSTSLGGFVTLVSGEESGRLPARERLFGFCFQRSKVSESELGPWSRRAVEMLAAQKTGRPAGDPSNDAEAARVTKRLLAEPITLSRRSFAGRSTETLTLDLFRWLVRERGLRDVEIRHFVFQRERRWLTGYLTGLLQARHDLRGREDSVLKRSLLKLVLNGFYGYTSIQASSFPKTSIVSETTLRKLPEEEKVRRLLPCRGVSVTLLGCRDEEDDDRARPPELLYAVTTGNENAALFNTLQVAVSILGQSKRIFFGMILTILRHYSPSMVSIAYCDTDSVLLAAQHLDLGRCYDGPDEAYDAVRRSLFEDPDDEAEQAGKLKVENIFAAGLFRNPKAYRLDAPVRDGTVEAEASPTVRMRSIPRALHERLGKKLFGPDPTANSAVARFVRMGPTRGLEVVKTVQSHSLSVAVNTKLFARNPVHTDILD